MFIPRAAGHFMMRENGWEPVPAKVSRKFTRWNFDAYFHRHAGAMVGHAYKHDSVSIDGFAIEYEVRMITTGAIHFATVTFPTGEWCEVRNVGRMPTTAGMCGIRGGV
jgi:hypothetical protein